MDCRYIGLVFVFSCLKFVVGEYTVYIALLSTAVQFCFEADVDRSKQLVGINIIVITLTELFFSLSYTRTASLLVSIYICIY